MIEKMDQTILKERDKSRYRCKGKRRIEKNHEMTKLNKNEMIKGKVETEILYEEADGNWLRLQGLDRKKYGSSREMKIMIAYDGVKYHAQKNNTYRRELDNKVAYASFESVKN